MTDSHQAPPVHERDRWLTLYGRMAVREALADPDLDCQRLHLATSNREQGVIADLRQLAARRNVPVREHDRQSLSRISRNGKQDQGVALDVRCPRFAGLDGLDPVIARKDARLLGLDGITNPQNVGMIIRSAVAAGIDGILYPRRGVAALGPLVIKASVGTVFRAPLVFCDTLTEALERSRAGGATIAALAGDADTSLFDFRPRAATVYLLGNETDGVSAANRRLADTALRVPMAAGVESLNVAVTAALIGYATRLD